jgi:acyl-CoA thioesterase FadM
VIVADEAPGRYRGRLSLAAVDAAGVIFYPELFRLAHEAFEHHLYARGIDVAGLLRGGGAFPVVHARADYRAPMSHGDEFVIRVRVAEAGETSMGFAMEFTDLDDRPLARVETVHVWLQAGEPAPLPALLRDTL